MGVESGEVVVCGLYCEGGDSTPKLEVFIAGIEALYYEFNKESCEPIDSYCY